MNDTVRVIRGKEAMPSLFEYGGKIYASNLFRLHSEVGFSLADSMMQCKARGWIPCTDQFVSDAIRGGITKEKAEAMVKAALVDSGAMAQ